MKTTFARQFGLTASLILLCVVFLGAGFRTLLFSNLVDSKHEALSNNAHAVANLAAAYDSAGQMEDNWDFRMSLSFVSSVAETDTVICDENGVVVLCSCPDLYCVHLGKTISEDLVQNVHETGEVYSHSKLDGLYDEARYYVAVSVTPYWSESPIGVVLVSSVAEDISTMLSSTFQIFFLTAGVVMLIALAVTSILARHEAQRLRALADTAQRFGHGDLRARAKIDDGYTVEMQELATEFNNMAISLEQSELRRREFVANVSHELKTPMTTIAGFMDGMLDGTIPTDRHRQYMQKVSDEVRRLSRLVRSMLDISRLQSQGIAESQKSRFDIVAAAGSVLVSFEQKITERKIEVEADLPEEPLYVWGHLDSITQVIYNLTDNAVKFCETGGSLWVRVQTVGGKAKVTVGNTGPTIPEKELPLLFDRFHKMDKSRSVDREGYGLGLYIVKTIIGSHGEDLFVSSQDGKTEFTFTMPVKK